MFASTANNRAISQISFIRLFFELITLIKKLNDEDLNCSFKSCLESFFTDSIDGRPCLVENTLLFMFNFFLLKLFEINVKKMS